MFFLIKKKSIQWDNTPVQQARLAANSQSNQLRKQVVETKWDGLDLSNSSSLCLLRKIFTETGTSTLTVNVLQTGSSQDGGRSCPTTCDVCWFLKKRLVFTIMENVAVSTERTQAADTESSWLISYWLVNDYSVAKEKRRARWNPTQRRLLGMLKNAAFCA